MTKKQLKKWQNYSKKLLFEENNEKRSKNSLQHFTNNDKVDLYHYSDFFDRDKEKVVLDPEAAWKNSNSFTEKDRNASNLPRIFFYLDPKDNEKWFSTDSHTLYHTRVEASSIYDIYNDPLGYKKEIKKISWGPLDIDLLLKTISGVAPNSNLKYKGVFYVPSYGPVVNWFEPIKVRRIDGPPLT